MLSRICKGFAVIPTVTSLFTLRPARSRASLIAVRATVTIGNMAVECELQQLFCESVCGHFQPYAGCALHLWRCATVEAAYDAPATGAFSHGFPVRELFALHLFVLVFVYLRLVNPFIEGSVSSRVSSRSFVVVIVVFL